MKKHYGTGRLTGSLPMQQKKQRRRFRRCDGRKNAPVSRLSAPCCDFVGKVGEVSLPTCLRGVCGPCEVRLRSWECNGYPCGYRVENQAGERDGAAWRLRTSSLRPAVPAASRLSGVSERENITVPDLGKRFLVRCFHSLKTRGFNE